MGVFSEMDEDVKVEQLETAVKKPVSAVPDVPASDVPEDPKRIAHEQAEAKRKAEWEAAQAAKKAAEQEQIQRVAAMSDDEVMTSSMNRIGADTERLTRRNMKECVCEYIQTLCLSDPAFARRAMHPRKSMIHCIWYINRKAREYVEHEMKDNDLKPDRNGVYGSDVPDELCYQWAEEYFNDPNAQEDQEKEEKFVAKPYTGGRGKTTKKPAKKAAPPEKKVEKHEDDDQITLGDMMGEPV